MTSSNGTGLPRPSPADAGELRPQGPRQERVSPRRVRRLSISKRTTTRTKQSTFPRCVIDTTPGGSASSRANASPSWPSTDRPWAEPWPWKSRTTNRHSPSVADDITVRVTTEAIELRPGSEVVHKYLLYNGPVKPSLLGDAGRRTASLRRSIEPLRRQAQAEHADRLPIAGLDRQLLERDLLDRPRSSSART